MAQKPRLLIFPASYYQLETIGAAQRMGFEVVTFDNNPSNPGHALAEYSHILDVRDADSAVKLAERYEIVGAASVCSDVSLMTLARICEQRGLPGPSVATVQTLTSKIAFRRWQARNGCSPIPFIACTDTDELPGNLDAIGDVIVVKPDIASGSKGISIVHRHELTVEHLRYAAHNSLNQAVVIERQLKGRHGTLEGFFHKDGRLGLAAITSRMRNPRDGIGTIGHVFPGDFSKAEQDSIRESVSSIYQSFGYREGPVDCDFVVENGLVYVLETSSRLGGNSLSRLVETAFGISLPRLYLQHVTHQEVDLPASYEGRPTATWLITSDRTGELYYDPERLTCLQKVPWVAHAALDWPSGHSVRAFRDGRDRLGEIVISAASLSEAWARRDEALRILDLAIVSPLTRST